jgi:hypothetical protein
VQKEKDRYPFFPELLKHESAEERLTAIANDREQWWQEVRNRRANSGESLVRLYVNSGLDHVSPSS